MKFETKSTCGDTRVTDLKLTIVEELYEALVGTNIEDDMEISGKESTND